MTLDASEREITVTSTIAAADLHMSLALGGVDTEGVTLHGSNVIKAKGTPEVIDLIRAALSEIDPSAQIEVTQIES